MLRSSRMGRCISILARSKTTPAQSSCSLSLGRFPPRLTNNFHSVYDQLPSPASGVPLVGGNYDFPYGDIKINGQPVDPIDFQCSRCGAFNTLDFSHNDGTFHVDTANPWFIPIGSVMHLVVDLIGGHTVEQQWDTKNSMSYIRVFWAIAGLFYGPSTAVAQSKAPTYDAPILYQEVIEDLHNNRPEHFPPSILLQMNRAGVIFLNGEQLIVYAVESTGQLSSRKSAETSSAYRLRIRLLDIPSGKVVLTKDSGSRAHGSTVQVTTGGILVNTGELMKMYSLDLAKSRNLTLPIGGEDLLSSRTSATGKTIMVNRISQRERISHVDVLDAGTLKVKQSWDESPPLYRDYSISDQQIVAHSAGHSVVVADFESKKWEAVRDNPGSQCFLGSPSLVAEETLVVQSCGNLVLLNTTGTSYLLGPLDGQTSDKTAVAQEGQFVAVSLDTVEVEKHLLSESSSRVTATHVAVFDLNKRKRIFTVNVEPLPRDDYDFALSPDGSKVAILNDRTVSVYQVARER